MRGLIMVVVGAAAVEGVIQAEGHLVVWGQGTPLACSCWLASAPHGQHACTVIGIQLLSSNMQKITPLSWAERAMSAQVLLGTGALESTGLRHACVWCTK